MSMPKPFESKRITPVEDRVRPEELREFMNKHGISVLEFSQVLGVSRQAIKLWLDDKRDVTITNSRIIRLLNKYPQLIKEF